MEISNSVLELIGNTPLVKLNRITMNKPFDVYVKLEYMNPSGSLKDRIAMEMIKDAEEEGALQEGYKIIEASTGNTGTALSLVGNYLGYPVEIFMPEGMTLERKRLINNFGGRILELESQETGDGSVAGAEVEISTRMKCLELESTCKKVWWARQFSNSSNTKAHMKTGEEIINQMEGGIDAFIASIGVGGTLYGVAKTLKEKMPGVLLIGAEPASAKFPLSEGFSRVPGACSAVTGGIIEEMINSRILDRIIKVGNQEAVKMSDRLIREEGLLCGISSGANVHVACKIGEEIGENKQIVTVLPDSRNRYYSNKIYTT
jgi:cysteine synthase A